ncbi:peptide MFS transporter [Haliangium ochraceum]|uniref:Amino acid/peptide transporter n=1 Tax=Haliangium ochraceum (strain DSM 14365 / JCM 11303 / SMP-2) TaxID=502025 RepID=D0LUJ2_HALO1|nr:peptide MFS transporter [Haliangium ochraceum]ACY19315.1 amino acid/peptide transporter [Haliangium ochraceum DSM 14365]
MADAPIAAAADGDDHSFFGHPRGLLTLFFTELWERFSYYGMRALLLLFMTTAAAEGGMGIDATMGGAVYGLYTFGVYALALPGGWIADRLLGKRKAVLYGGILIALGHFSMAVPNTFLFFAGLVLIAIGTGLLKPNVSAVVGDLYSDKGARRDAGFSIFYMGINIGAFLGPLVCSGLGESIDWHLGFGAAGVGMAAAVVFYIQGMPNLRGAGELSPELATPSARASAIRSLLIGLGALAGLAGLLVALVLSGTVDMSLVGFVEGMGYAVSGGGLLYFLLIIVFVCRDNTERKRVGACAILFVGAALFWAGFEQAGSTMTLFAEQFTNRNILGFEVPAGALQSVNPLFIIIMAPVMGFLWVALGKRNPSIPVKFGFGLVLLGVGFLVLAWGAQGATASSVGMHWLVVTYFFHTVGELCLSPVGLSSVTKLAPERLVSQMMGTWFMGAALGNLIAGLSAGSTESLPPDELFQVTAYTPIIAGVLFLLAAPLIRKLTAGVD